MWYSQTFIFFLTQEAKNLQLSKDAWLIGWSTKRIIWTQNHVYPCHPIPITSRYPLKKPHSSYRLWDGDIISHVTLASTSNNGCATFTCIFFFYQELKTPSDQWQSRIQQRWRIKAGFDWTGYNPIIQLIQWRVDELDYIWKRALHTRNQQKQTQYPLSGGRAAPLRLIQSVRM